MLTHIGSCRNILHLGTDCSQTLVQGPDAKRGDIKMFDLCKGALKNYYKFSSEIEFTCFSMWLTQNGGPEFS